MGAFRASLEYRGTVVVLDDDPVTVRCLVLLLSARHFRVQTFSSHLEILSSKPPSAPACLILDLILDGAHGLEVRNQLKLMGWDMPTVVLTSSGDLATAVRAMREGADDFLSKPSHPEELIAAVERAIERSRRTQYERHTERELIKRVASLTLREREVISLVAQGLLNKQIAACLRLALVTVKVHRGKAMRKLGARTPAELVRIARITGICSLQDTVAPPLKRGSTPSVSAALI